MPFCNDRRRAVPFCVLEKKSCVIKCVLKFRISLFWKSKSKTCWAVCYHLFFLSFHNLFSFLKATPSTGQDWQVPLSLSLPLQKTQNFFFLLCISSGFSWFTERRLRFFAFSKIHAFAYHPLFVFSSSYSSDNNVIEFLAFFCLSVSYIFNICTPLRSSLRS